VSVPSCASDFPAIGTLLSPRPAAWYVASVFEAAANRLEQWVRSQRPGDVVRTLRHDDFPITLEVNAPAHVGVDRLAGAVAANALRHRDRPAIVVDAGTAITVNALSPAGRFLGGAIVPGRQMAATALCEKTALLPLIGVNDDPPAPAAIGKSTAEAIQSGLYWGTIGALQRLIDEMQQVLKPPVDLFVTGGGMGNLVGGLPAAAQFVPDLVLRGIVLAAISRGRGAGRRDR
jgi:type III pantothenate kinase